MRRRFASMLAGADRSASCVAALAMRRRRRYVGGSKATLRNGWLSQPRIADPPNVQ